MRPQLFATYTYDFFGRRIKKNMGSKATFYLYSDEGLIGEYGATGNEIKLCGYRSDSTWTKRRMLSDTLAQTKKVRKKNRRANKKKGAS
jgi:hypothetical protein